MSCRPCRAPKTIAGNRPATRRTDNMLDKLKTYLTWPVVIFALGLLAAVVCTLIFAPPDVRTYVLGVLVLAGGGIGLHLPAPGSSDIPKNPYPPASLLPLVAWIAG